MVFWRPKIKKRFCQKCQRFQSQRPFWNVWLIDFQRTKFSWINRIVLCNCFGKEMVRNTRRLWLSGLRKRRCFKGRWGPSLDPLKNLGADGKEPKGLSISLGQIKSGTRFYWRKNGPIDSKIGKEGWIQCFAWCFVECFHNRLLGDLCPLGFLCSQIFGARH